MSLCPRVSVSLFLYVSVSLRLHMSLCFRVSVFVCISASLCLGLSASPSLCLAASLPRLLVVVMSPPPGASDPRSSLIQGLPLQIQWRVATSGVGLYVTAFIYKVC